VEARLQLESFDGRHLVLESARDITERKEWEDRQRMLLSELSHRIRNTFAVVQAIARQTFHHLPALTEPLSIFEGRLAALGAAQALLMESNWVNADFATFAVQQLQPYTSDDPERVALQGDALSLPAELATPLGLIIYELATNAAKYGALSIPDGSVDLKWSIKGQDGQRILAVTWHEKNGPAVQPPNLPGSGSTLIERAIPKATVKRVFNPDGIVCTIEVPWHAPEVPWDRPSPR